MKLATLGVELCAIIAQPVAAGSGFAFPCGYVSSRRTRAVVVMNALMRWFLGFVDRIESCYFRHKDFLSVIVFYKLINVEPPASRAVELPYSNGSNTSRLYMTYIV
jgi:hypothetical protein